MEYANIFGCLLDLEALNSSCQQRQLAPKLGSLKINLFPESSTTSTSSVSSAGSTINLSFPSAASSTSSTLSLTPSTILRTARTSSHLFTWSTASSTGLYISTSSYLPSLLTISTTSAASLSTSSALTLTSTHGNQKIVSISVGAAIGSAAAFTILALIIVLVFRRQRRVFKRRLRSPIATTRNGSQGEAANEIVDLYEPYIYQAPVEMDAKRAVNEAAGSPVHELVGSKVIARAETPVETRQPHKSQ